MANIKMEALRTFNSFEGHKRKGEIFLVNTITRALQLEHAGAARRVIKEDQPEKVPGPSERQTKKPNETKRSE